MDVSPQRGARGDAAVKRVLGVDPGTVYTGWGIVEERGHTLRYVASGVLRLDGARVRRLAAIHRTLRALCEQYVPHAVVIEQTFVGDNIQTAFRLGEARGAVMVAAAHTERVVVEYSPAEIKVAVTGNGRASKTQMQTMVGRLLNVTALLAADEADALGAAICHLHSARFAASVMAPALPVRRPRRRGRAWTVG